jgi:hypothetical protein
MSSGFQELAMWPVELIGRGGRPAAVVAIVVGLSLLGLGLWLTYGLLGPGAYWPIMLSVAMCGVALTVSGLAVLFGAQAKVTNADTVVDHAAARHDVSSTSLPFWVCGACKIVRTEFTLRGRCDQCASVVDYMKVDNEADRKLAVGLLS